ncbi:MAG: M28 family peptidase [Acidobacteria bacterium]|nr:M28 family peptidase [Acidobacteriota bacterium]
MRTRRGVSVVCSALLLCAGAAAAQESPFVSAEMFRTLGGEISGDISYDHLRHLTLHHSINGASRGFRDKQRWIAERARQFGLEGVRIIDDIRYKGPGWSPLAAELYIVSPDPRRLISFQDSAVAIADYSRSGTWEGELVDVAAGVTASDYDSKDVKGKIVLASGSPATAMEQAVWKRGALGVVYYNAARGMDHPDQVAWTRLNPRPPNGKENTFAFSLSYRAGMELRQRLAPRPKPGPTPGSFGEGVEPGEKIVVRAKVEAEFEENPKQWIVEGWIRGAQRHDQQIVLTAHAQEEKFSANDDNSGCANLLEIGRALVKLIAEGKLPRPARDIRFWWTNEIDAEYEYFAAHPDERGKILLNINQDMVGAKQSAGSRIQHITRTPWSRPSFLNDVVESIATMVMRGNSAYLAAAQAGAKQPFSKPIVSRMGTRERYAAEIVPYFDSTDHLVFNDVIIGLPGVTLTNWPDDFIHSSDDDLWQMDPTQLQRNAFIVAATALYFGNLESAGLPGLSVQVRAGAQHSLNEAYRRANEILTLAAPAERPAAFLDGTNLIAQTRLRAGAALDSLRVLGADAKLAAELDEWKTRLGTASNHLLQDLGRNYSVLSGGPLPPTARLREEEKAMAGKVPVIAGRIADFLEKRRDLDKTGLHPLMSYEVWNFVDGKRSYLDIYHAVRAEAQSVGAWYYGTVSAKQVADLLDAGVKAGLLKLKP